MGNVKVKPPAKPKSSPVSPRILSSFSDHFRKEWYAPRELCGLPRLGFGAAKAAYDLGNGNVIKLAMRPRKGSQLAREVKRWKTAPAELRRYLVPTLDWDRSPICRWSVQPKVDSVGEYQWDSDEVNKLYDVCSKYGVADVGGNNIGRLNGRLVVLDYGITD